MRLSCYRFLGLFTLAVLGYGCGGTNAPDAGPRPTIGVSTLTLTHSFHQDLAEALQAEADARGYDVVLTASEFDVARQRNQVSDFIVQGVDAIVLMPADSRAIGTTIQEANAAGIPVFTADIAALAEGVDVVTHIATDNYAGGRMAGQAVAEAIGGRGQIAIIDHPEVESVIQRTQGFRDALDELNEGGAALEVVTQLSGGGVRDRAYRVAEDILQAHASLDAIFAINDDTALGAVAAIEKAGKDGQVKVVGFDGTPEARRAIRDGKIFADVIQHPREIGRQTVAAIDDYLSGEALPEQTLIPATLYTSAEARTDTTLAAEAP